jgi:hypothetical protein
MSRHVAIKCTYNNGGEGALVGFAGTCSRDNIKLNTSDRPRVWCSNDKCPCKKLFVAGLSGPLPSDDEENAPCYESRLFVDWKYGAGWHLHGARRGKPIHLTLGSDGGGVAILTTLFPGSRERDRHIVGLFRILRVKNDPEQATSIEGASTLGIRLPLEEAKRLFFWDYYSTESAGPDWRTGLVRYLSDAEVAKILKDILGVTKDEHAQHVATKLLSDLRVDESDIAKVSGARGTTDRTFAARVSQLNKYGPGGEGPDHLRLKNWVSEHPESLGLTSSAKPDVEHQYLSGDRVDILFSLGKNRFTTVEIETLVPWPGAHQVIKYRALQCAERGLSIVSDKVTGVLVAWKIPPDVRSFCDRYGILCVEKRV